MIEGTSGNVWRDLLRRLGLLVVQWEREVNACSSVNATCFRNAVALCSEPSRMRRYQVTSLCRGEGNEIF